MSESNLLNTIPEDRLESWKEIASFLRRGVRTVQRWEKDEGLPIHRHRHSSLDSVYAFRHELKEWQKSRKKIAPDSEPASLSDAEALAFAAPDAPVNGDIVFPTRKSNVLKEAVFGIALVVLLAGTFLFFSPQRGGRIHTDLTPVPLSTHLGEERSPALSPDGSKVAFVWNGERRDNFDIYVKSVNSSQMERLTNSPETDYSPAWSPDGKWIAFCRGSQKPEGELWIVSASGGAEHRLSKLQSIATPSDRALSWSPDGKFLVVSHPLRASDPDGLNLLNVETGEETRLTDPKPGESDVAPAVSPNGKWIAFSRDTGRAVSAVYLLPFDSRRSVQARHKRQPPREPHRLSWRGLNYVYAGNPAWTPDSKQVVFDSNRGGNHNLWMASIDRPEEASLLPYGNDLSSPSISAAGQLAFTHEALNVNIWKIDVHGKNTAPAQVVSSTRVQDSPSVSPDGKKLAFSSNQAGYTEIWTSSIDGANATQITSMEVPITGSPSWSPDGTTIAYDSRVSARPQIFFIAAGGGRPIALTDGSHIDVVPHFSPDGKWIYFSSRRTGQTQIWRMPATGGAAQQITENGGFAGVFSPDGKYLYYSRGNAPVSSLWQRQMSTGAERCIDFMVPDRAFTPAEDGVFYRLVRPDKKQDLMFLNLRSNKSERLFTLGKSDGVGMSMSPDNRTLYFAQEDQHNWDLQLVPGFWR